MFGYVVPNRDELKIREFNEYRTFYCGLCRRLRKKHGFMAQFSVNYDMTFLSLLYADLYDREVTCEKKRCALHMCKGCFVSTHDYLDYIADMNVYLTWLKCNDDWNDNHSLKKKIYGAFLKGKAKKIRATRPVYAKLDELMAKLGEKEKAYASETDALVAKIASEKKDKEEPGILSESEMIAVSRIEELADIFGEMLGNIFALHEDHWHKRLYDIGFFLGKFVYLLDAFDDLNDDYKKGEFNGWIPLKDRDGFAEMVREVLTFNISEVARIYKQLPLVTVTEILDNIIFDGVWVHFVYAKAKYEGKSKRDIKRERENQITKKIY